MSRRRGSDAGQSTLELIAMTPVVLTLTGLLLQLGAVAWAVTDTTEAARQGARASSMDRDGCAAAEAALSGALDLVPRSCNDGGGEISLQVEAPILVPGFDDVTITRTAALPDLSDR